MNSIKDNSKLIGKKIGTINIHVYDDINSDSQFYYINMDNKKVLPLSYKIEKTLLNV